MREVNAKGKGKLMTFILKNKLDTNSNILNKFRDLNCNTNEIKIIFS